MGRKPKLLPPLTKRRKPQMDEARDIIASMILVSEAARRDGPGIYNTEWYRTTIARGCRMIGETP